MNDRFIAIPAYVAPDGKINLKGTPLSGLKTTEGQAQEWACEQVASTANSGVNTFFIAHIMSEVKRSNHPVSITAFSEKTE